MQVVVVLWSQIHEVDVQDPVHYCKFLLVGDFLSQQEVLPDYRRTVRCVGVVDDLALDPDFQKGITIVQTGGCRFVVYDLFVVERLDDCSVSPETN